MDWLLKLFLAASLLANAAIQEAQADALITGSVFCDQCKDGPSLLDDFPLYGAVVSATCMDENDELTVWKQATTNWLGNYAMRFDGEPDLTSCRVQVLGGGHGRGWRQCGAEAGPAKNVRLLFKVFDTEIYTAEHLFSEPEQPMPLCSRRPANLPLPITNPGKAPPARRHPSRPLVPLLEASACTSGNWTDTDYRCYWKALKPKTKVANVFGLIAARRYGTNMTLWQGIMGRGEPYKALLREATTALLNSYNSLQFSYHPLGVIQEMNWALIGPTRGVLHTALRFKRANSGNGRVGCRFKVCK